MTSIHLGDDVYIGPRMGGGLVLFTDTHIPQEDNDVIYLPDDVLHALRTYIDRYAAEQCKLRSGRKPEAK